MLRQFVLESTPATCRHTDEALCLGCGAAWCHECDPGPAALCHYCHGRGYSTAEWTPPMYDPTEQED